MTENAVQSVIGFKVKTITVVPGKGTPENGDEDIGKIKVVLEADKSELRAGQQNLTGILGALTMHQSTLEDVAVQLRF